MEQVEVDARMLAGTGARSGIFRRLVLRQLSGMDRGHMRIVLPEGTVVELGDRTAEHHAMVRVVREEFFRKCVLFGDVGFGEAYVDGDWETPGITDVIAWFLMNVDRAPGVSGSRRRSAGLNVLRVINRVGHLLRDNTPRGSRRNIAEHYDLSNDFFARVLDPGMTYSCACFADPAFTLEQAQTEKYDRLCRRLGLAPGHRVLEIGSGWGGFAVHAAGRYGCRVTSISVSREQVDYARRRVREQGLGDRVEIRLQDYRTVTGSFDRIVSIEMLEAVGHRHMETFFARCHEALAQDGLMGLQVIVAPDARYDELRRGVDWIQKHVFPGSLLPSIARINRAVNRTGDMSLHDLLDLGPHYARTLRQWRTNFNRNREGMGKLGADERFVRTWNYYLSYCEAAFAMRNISVVQMIYTRPNNAALGRIPYRTGPGEAIEPAGGERISL